MTDSRKLFWADGAPRHIKAYDNGGTTADRYTVVFTGGYRHRTGGMFWNVCMSPDPFHPQGVGQHGESKNRIDYPSYAHLGKQVPFLTLPDPCRFLVIRDYCNLWDAVQPAVPTPEKDSHSG